VDQLSCLGRPRHGRQHNEVSKLNLAHELEGSKQRTVEDAVVGAGRQQVQEERRLVLVLDLLHVT